MKLKAILFDLDGTLRDTREVIYPALEHALKEHLGKSPTREKMLPYIHYHRAIHKEFAPNIDYSEFRSTYMGKLDELRITTIAYEGANDIVKKLRTAGYKLGIVTSGPSAAEYLAGQGIADNFDVIVGGNDVKEHKPSPIPVIAALNALGIKPKEAVMIGDLQVDIIAARAAGLRATIGITHGFGTAKMLTDAGADYIIHSFKELGKALKEVEAT